MKHFSPLVSLLLASLLAAGPLLGQSPMAATAAPLELRIAQQDDAKPTPGNFSIAVTDEAGKPVEGAAVVFRLAAGSVGNTFADGSQISIAQTDASGRARVDGLRSAGVGARAAAVQVTATKGTAHAGVLLSETLAPTPAAAPAALRPMETSSALPAAPMRAAAILQAADVRPPVPGVVVEVRGTTARQAAAAGDDSLDANVPARHLFGSESGDDSAAGVSVEHGNNFAEPSGHGKAKWIIAIAAAAGAGAAFALLHKGSSSTSTSASGISIGSPSISVGHP